MLTDYILSEEHNAAIFGVYESVGSATRHTVPKDLCLHQFKFCMPLFHLFLVYLMKTSIT